MSDDPIPTGARDGAVAGAQSQVHRRFLLPSRAVRRLQSTASARGRLKKGPGQQGTGTERLLVGIRSTSSRLPAGYPDLHLQMFNARLISLRVARILGAILTLRFRDLRMVFKCPRTARAHSLSLCLCAQLNDRAGDPSRRRPPRCALASGATSASAVLFFLTSARA